MSPPRLGTLVLLIAAFATACGTSQASTPDSALPKASSAPAAAPDSGHGADSSGGVGFLDMTSVGDDGVPASVRYVRIETLQGQSVVEKEFRTPIRLKQSLTAGQYRVMTWRRDCAGTCPTQGEKGLGAPVNICGAKATIRSDAVTQATIRLTPETDCTLETSPSGP